MPLFVGLLWGGFVSVLGSLVGRILIALAITYVSYQGIDVLIQSVKTSALASMGAMGVLSGVVGMLKLGECMNVVVSAVVAKYTIGGLTSGAVTKMVLKK
jgi:hypothetical protein